MQTVEQISVFLENRSGRLAEVTRVLAEQAINIRALSLADTSDFGILRLIVSDFTRAQAVLQQSGFTTGRTEVIAVAVADNPGGLYTILDMFTDRDINVEYMYAFTQQTSQEAVLVFRFDRTQAAFEVFEEHGVRTVSGQELDHI